MRLAFIPAFVLGLLVSALPSAAQSRGEVVVTVLDQTDQSVPGATVTLTRAGAPPAVTISDAEGRAVFTALAAGTYTVNATLEGFADAPPGSVRMSTGQTSRVTIRLGVPRVSDAVTVTASAGPAAETSVQSNDVLSTAAADDTILQNTINALAGADNAVRVDGLTSGNLPPAATIQQIRIRQNSFDAEYHEATPAFVEIVTNSKPQPWQMNVTLWDAPQDAQARNAFMSDAPGAERSGTNFNGNGNIRNRASVSFFGNYNSGRDDQPIVAQTLTGPLHGLVSNPNRFAFGTARIGLDNWRHNDLRLETDYQDNHFANVGAGGYNLPERGYQRDQTTMRARAFWTRAIGKGGSHVLRVQFQRRTEDDLPQSTAPAVVVLNAFSSGGAQVQGSRLEHQTEISDVVTLPVGTKQVWRGGLLFWHDGLDSSVVNNSGGTFTFSSLDAYALGRPTTFTQRIGTAACCFGVSQLGLWAQDDIALGKTVAMSLGVRQESENHLSRSLNPAPRAQVDWSPARVPHTTFHAGSGVFYRWLLPLDVEQTVRVDGVHQQDVLIVDPGFPAPTVGTTGVPLPSGRYLLSPDLTLPRLVRSSIGVDHTIGALTLHADYAHQSGGQFRGRNLNAPDVAGVRPNPTFGNVIQVESTGRSQLDALTSSAQFSNQKHGSFFRINYTLARARDDSDGSFFVPLDPFNPEGDWGPSSNDVRHRISGNLSQQLLNRRVQLSTYWQYSSATPYTVTTGFDANGDGIFNERPAGVGRNGSRGFAQFYQGAYVAWQLPKGVAPPGTQPRHRVSIWVQADNIWNYVNRAGVSGVLTSPFFGHATAAGQPRRLYMGISAGF